MTMTIDRPSRRTASTASASQRLRTSFAAARISFVWWGTRKSLSSDQREQAAESFGAECQYISAAKKLVNTRDEKFAAVSAVRHKILSYWRSMSLPFPEAGTRLVRQADIEGFDRKMQEYRAELTRAVEELDQHFGQLKAAARQRLGSLYDEADYPASLAGLFEVSWSFPNVEAPSYLMQLDPALYRQEQARVRARFDEAVRLAQEAFVAQMSRLVDHLVERLGSEADGTRKVFRDSAVGSLTEFIGRFRLLNVTNDSDLERLVQVAENAIRGIEPQAIRDNDALRQHLASQLTTVAAGLDQMLVDQPRRRILRPVRQEAG